MTNSLEALFCHVDDFWQIFEPKWQQLLLGNGLQQRQRSGVRPQYNTIIRQQQGTHPDLVCSKIAPNELKLELKLLSSKLCLHLFLSNAYQNSIIFA